MTPVTIKRLPREEDKAVALPAHKAKGILEETVSVPAELQDKRESLEAVRLNADDSVAVALTDLPVGQVVQVAGEAVELSSDIPAYHKFALREHASGDPIIRFGNVIATATQSIKLGEHVHTHNAGTTLSGTKAYAFQAREPQDALAEQKPDQTFLGYRRTDGRVGTRNEIWIIPTVGCVARVCEQIARQARQFIHGNIDAVEAFPHVLGCSQLGDDLGATRDILADLVAHPNAGGVLLVGLGCENNQASLLLASAGDFSPDRVKSLIAQSSSDEIEEGVLAVRSLIETAALDVRTPCPMSDLVVGLKCGGSDALSGVTANPLLGELTDRVTAAGGFAMLTEIPEIFGAEHLLMERAASPEVFEQIATLVNDFKSHFLNHGQKVHENPSPGNKAGGITTLEEKSLGAVQKAGSATVTDVIRYGQRLRKSGLTLLEAPGNDAVSSTALAAAGATVILFTTGRGTPLGFPVPTIKIASNSALAERKPGWIDFDAGRKLDPEQTDGLSDRFLDYVLDVASGEKTANERNGEKSIAIWKRGVTL